MKIRSVTFNNKRKDFEVRTSGKKYAFPYVKASPSPASDDQVTRVYVDKELGREGFTYELQSGKTEPSTSNRYWNTTEIPIT